MNKELLEIALSQYGIYEWAGEDHNPEVLKYFDETGNAWVDDDETAWCSAFVNWVAMKAGYEYTKKLNARSWLEVGNEVLGPVELPEIGDVLVFWRIAKDSVYGHVGFYINEDKNYYYVLGGNQSNQVRISMYPKTRLLSVRRLNKINE